MATSEASSTSPYVFLSVDGLCQRDFADAFDIQETKLPTMAVYSPKKRRAANYIGSFSESQLRQFLQGVISGTRPTSPMSAPPAPTDADCAALAQELKATMAMAADGGAGAGEDEGADDMMAEVGWSQCNHSMGASLRTT